jgi:hypothetical protein
MAFVAADWTITRSTGAIRYIGDDHAGASPSYATVIELHRALQDFADDASSSGDDQLDITDDNPSERSTDNIITLLGDYNIDDTASEHLYDGSIIQGTGATRIIYDGIVNFGNVEAIQIIQNGAVLTDDWWNVSGGGLNADADSGISHRFMIKTVNNNSDIDGRRLIGISRKYGNSYEEFSINGTSRGNNVLALADATDLNNQTAEGTVSGYSTIAKTEGYTASVDIDPTVATEEYYITWDKGSQTINDLYEYTKYISRDGSTTQLFGLDGELFRGVTHQVAYSSLAGGTFTEGSSVTINASTAQVLADDGSGVMWVQLLTGPAPASSDSMSQGGVTATAGTVTERTIPSVILGQSTGSAIIGAYGVAVEAADVTASDQFFDLSNQTINPPNNVTFSVTGLVSGEDRVLVGPASTGTDLQLNQLASATAVTAGAVPSTFSVSTSIPSDTPASGTIRVADDSGFYVLVSYTGYSGSNFTGCTGTFANNAASGNNVFISYIDELASSTQATFTSVYSSDRDLVVKVRDGGASPIKEFITASTLGSNGGSVAAIRTSDA